MFRKSKRWSKIVIDPQKKLPRELALGYQTTRGRKNSPMNMASKPVSEFQAEIQLEPRMPQESKISKSKVQLLLNNIQAHLDQLDDSLISKSHSLHQNDQDLPIENAINNQDVFQQALADIIKISNQNLEIIKGNSSQMYSSQPSGSPSKKTAKIQKQKQSVNSKVRSRKSSSKRRQFDTTRFEKYKLEQEFNSQTRKQIHDNQEMKELTLMPVINKNTHKVLNIDEQTPRKRNLKTVLDLPNNREFKKVIATKQQLVVVEFAAQWSQESSSLQQKIKILAIEEPKVIFARVDVRKNEETTIFCDIQAIPTFLFYMNGQKVDFVENPKIYDIIDKIQVLKPKIQKLVSHKQKYLSLHKKGRLEQIKNQKNANIEQQKKAIQDKEIANLQKKMNELNKVKIINEKNFTSLYQMSNVQTDIGLMNRRSKSLGSRNNSIRLNNIFHSHKKNRANSNGFVRVNTIVGEIQDVNDSISVISEEPEFEYTGDVLSQRMQLRTVIAKQRWAKKIQLQQDQVEEETVRELTFTPNVNQGYSCHSHKHNHTRFYQDDAFVRLHKDAVEINRRKIRNFDADEQRRESMTTPSIRVPRGTKSKYLTNSTFSTEMLQQAKFRRPPQRLSPNRNSMKEISNLKAKRNTAQIPEFGKQYFDLIDKRVDSTEMPQKKLKFSFQ